MKRLAIAALFVAMPALAQPAHPPTPTEAQSQIAAIAMVARNDNARAGNEIDQLANAGVEAWKQVAALQAQVADLTKQLAEAKKVPDAPAAPK